MSLPNLNAPELVASDQGLDLSLDKQLCFALYLNANKVSRLYRPLLEPHGLTFSQYLALLALWDHAPCSVGHLCHVLELESSTVTPLLKRMEVMGYVSRTRDRSDERRVEIALTAKGLAFKIEAAKMRSRLMKEIGLPVSGIVAIRTSLQELSKAIDRQSATLPQSALRYG